MAARWAQDGAGKWMARTRGDGSLVGRGGFTRFDLHGEAVLELGWAVRDALRGRGYATEIGQAALTWAARHEPHMPIIAFTEVHNHASRAIMRRLHMRPAGKIRREASSRASRACIRTRRSRYIGSERSRADVPSGRRGWAHPGCARE